MEMEQIREQVNRCQACTLAKTRNQPVPGEGPADAVVMFIGEAPGKQEDLSGKPFVGAAGRLLDRLLAVAGIEREQVFITSILKCRPPGNRNPGAEEITACRAHLFAQIEVINPRIICPLGNFALQTLVGKEYTITDCRGRPRIVGGRTYLPMFHPAAALYNPGLKATMEEDMKFLGQLLAKDGG
jgi:uracil-DNA glycosylase